MFLVSEWFREFVLVYNESRLGPIHQKEQIACVYDGVHNVNFCEAMDSIGPTISPTGRKSRL